VPFNGTTVGEIFNKIKEGDVSFEDDVWQKRSKYCKEFIKALLN
jgi:hypothetical protein